MVHTITIFFFDRNCYQRFNVFQGRILSFSRTVHLHIARVKLWRFCIEKHQTSFLQICGLQTVHISIQLITRSGLSCSVVYTRGKSTPSSNWSRGRLKSGAALSSWLATWLLISGAEDLELVFVWREDTLNVAFDLTDCLDFVNLLSPFSLCFVEILHCWVKQRCRNVHIHTNVSFTR